MVNLPAFSRRAYSDAVPVHGVLGPLLVLVAWPTSWLHVGFLGQYSFFPLWLGFILVVDALVLRRRGTSLLTRSPVAFSGMFLLSAPLWWAFEGINAFTQNWRYLGAEQYSSLEYALIASWHFSVVIPAVFEAAELVGSFEFTRASGGERYAYPTEPDAPIEVKPWFELFGPRFEGQRRLRELRSV